MKVRKAAFVFFFFFLKIFSSRKGTHVVEFYLAENDCELFILLLLMCTTVSSSGHVGVGAQTWGLTHAR